MVETVEFMDPPPSKGGPKSNKYGPIGDALRDRPGEWALVADNANHNLAVRIREGTLPAFRPAGDFEATTRANGDGRFNIYARYVGEV